MNLNEMRDRAYQISKSKGWHDSEVDATFGDRIALMHSELSEALEEFRNGHTIDEIYDGAVTERTWISQDESKITLHKPEGIPIELADVVIRIGDLCGKYGIDLEAAVKTKMNFNETRPHRHGGKKI